MSGGILNISLDTETWGKRAGFDVRSIGACVFNPYTGEVPDKDSLSNVEGSPVFYMACDNPLKDHAIALQKLSGLYDSQALLLDGSYRKYNLKRDPITVGWWAGQPKEAQKAFDNPVDLAEVLSQFDLWLKSHGVDNKNQNSLRLWTHGAAFDTPITEELYYAVFEMSQDKENFTPWHYRAPRDTRTLFDLAHVGDHSEWLSHHSCGTLHHALHDAIGQAKAISAAICKIEGINDI